MIDTQISKKKLDIKKYEKWLTSDNTGCVNIFVGKVRSQNNGRKVKYLTFEVYENMALKEMRAIAEAALTRFAIDKVLIHHREGRVEIGQIPVIIAVSAQHRKPAILASKYIIDTLKKVVPIWKKEVYEDGEAWVTAHP